MSGNLCIYVVGEVLLGLLESIDNFNIVCCTAVKLYKEYYSHTYIFMYMFMRNYTNNNIF